MERNDETRNERKICPRCTSMTERMQRLYDISIELKQIIKNINRANRDEMVPKVNELINKREALIKQVKEPYTDDEKMLGQKLILLNEEIQSSMNNMLKEIKKDILQLKQNKSSNLSYINPYSKTEMTDGIYLDSKK